MGETDPCGPCSEICYDHGEKLKGGPPGSSEQDGDRFIEIWNLVFMQFEQVSKDKRVNLPKPSVDTGMGLERITAVLQGTHDNYSIDHFKKLIQSIPIWKNNIEIKTIDGGLTNQNFLVQENSNKFVVRLGDDIPEHLVSRSNELIVSKAAANAGISPKVIFHSKGILVLDSIESTTVSGEEVRKNIKSIIPLIKKIHHEIPKNLYGQSVIFWVFHVIRNYVKFLYDNKSSHSKILNNLIINCSKCPRLVKFRKKISTEKRKQYINEKYWGKPISGFGDENGQVLLIGLAPAAHGGNRTGRVFTGDRPADFLDKC